MSTTGGNSQVLTATIEIDPVRTLLVLGPQVTALCLNEAGAVNNNNGGHSPSFLSFKHIVEDGIRKTLELENFQSKESRDRKRLLLEHAYELEPAFAVHKVIETLKEHGNHDSWIKDLFHSNLHINPESSRTLQHLLYLRRKGVRIIYTHYDDLLAKALSLPVVLPDEGEEGIRKWSQGFPALLQLHGVYTKPHSIKMDCLCYQSIIGKGRVADIIREQFQSRTPIFIGYDNRFMDPFLPKLITSFATPTTMPTSLPLFLSLSRKPLMISDVLPMAVEPSTSLSSLVKISKTPLCVAPIHNSAHPVSLQLVCSLKEEVTEIFELLRNFTNILTNLHTLKDNGYYVVDLQMERSVLRTLWLHLLSPVIISKLQGLIGVELQGSFLVNFNPQRTVLDETVRASPPSFPALATPTSLWQLPGLSPHFTYSPSLVQETQKHLQFIHNQVTAGGGGGAVKIQSHNGSNNKIHLSKFSTSKSPRNHSEGSVTDEGETHETKNGLLINSQSGFSSLHHTSTPFLLNTKGLVNGSPYITTIPPSVPPFLVNLDGNKILEQHLKKEEEEEEEGDKTTTGSVVDITKNKREEFIKEAQEWSKKVETKIKSNFDITPPTTNESVTPPLMPRQFQVCSATIATPTSPNQSPLYQQAAYILAGSPHHSTNGIYSVVSPTNNSVIPPPSSLSFLPKTMDTPTSMSLNGIIARPGATPSLTTPTFTSGQKFMYMLQDGKLVTTTAPFDSPPPPPPPPPKEGMSNKRNPKRCGSPNSDPECSRPLKQRRRSSSLPDVNQLKCSPSPSPPPSPSPQDHTPLSSHQSIVSFVNGSQATPPIFFTNMHLPQTTTVNLEMQSEIGGDNLPPSPRVEVNLHPVPAGRGPIQLWQFLLDLLLSTDKTHLIQWTGNGYEFHIVQPEEIAKLWGARKNKPRMNYDKLSRGLRYYYSKGIMDKVPGKKLTFKYTCDINQYILQRSSNSTTPPTNSRVLVN